MKVGGDLPKGAGSQSDVNLDAAKVRSSCRTRCDRISIRHQGAQ